MKMTFSEAYDKLYPRETPEDTTKTDSEDEKMVEAPECPTDDPKEDE